MNKELVKKIIESGVEIPHFVILQLVATSDDLDDLWQNIKVRSYREALIRKGLISEINNKFYLTERGAEIYKTCKSEEEEEIVEVESLENPIKKVAKEIKEEVDKRIQAKTGDKKLINPSGKTYNASVRELETRITSFCKKFNNNDLNKIKLAILSYTDDLLDGKIKYPRILWYFIWREDKDKGLISDMESYMELIEDKKEDPTVKDTRDLF